MLNDNKVVVMHDDTLRGYHCAPPYSPSEHFPEYPHTHIQANGDNRVYRMVREAFRMLGLDAGRFGTKDWNPLGALIKPGNTVVIKPNLVNDHNCLSPKASGLPREICEDTECLVTQGPVIRAVADYVYKAVGPRGTIKILDLPCVEADFSKVLEISGIAQIHEFYAKECGINLQVMDLRERADKDAIGVDLGKDGCLHERAQTGRRWRRLASMYCDDRVMRRFHNPGKDVFFVARSVVESDVIISLPKMKTHKIAGVTGALKNFVGTTAHRKSVPHFTRGSVDSDGDEYPYPSILKRLAGRCARARAGTKARPILWLLNKTEWALFKLLSVKGADLAKYGWWYGNDTLWRSVLDINRIALYVSADGRMTDTMQRRHFALVDGIVAGEGEGPLAPTRKEAGVIIAGGSIVAVDAVMSTLMGFDYRRIPQICNAFELAKYPLCGFGPADIQIVSNNGEWDGKPLDNIKGIGFKPHYGWSGHIEK